MIYKEIETLVESKKGLNTILTNLQTDFELLEQFAQLLKDTESVDGNILTEIMQRSNGIWGELNIVFKAVDTFKRNRELVFFQTEKMRIEGKGEKFNVSATEKEGQSLTVDERRVRNIVEAYRDMAEKNVTTGQSILKYLTESRKTAIQEG